jgi:uncharacterized membrane protein
MPALPDPLHPAIVHLPIALAVLMPLAALAAAVAIRLGLVRARAWAAVVALQLALVLGGWMALETGEEEEDRVERVVAERHIEAHEERAERFETTAAIALLVLAAGLLPGTPGGVARAVSVVAAAVVLAAGVEVGHTGGELVYRHGAARAYVQGAGPTDVATSRRGHEHEEDDD